MKIGQRAYNRTSKERIGDIVRGTAYIATAAGMLWFASAIKDESTKYETRNPSYKTNDVENALPYSLALVSLVVGYAGLTRVSNKEIFFIHDR